jgi:two-component system sensor histidine kinase RegB
VREDFELIRNELTHCRSILDHMSANAGETMGEPLRPIAPIQLIREALGLLRTPERIRLDLGGLEDSSCTIAVPPQTFAHVLRGLLQNAIDASAAEKMVVLVAREEPEALRLEVHDHGQGMSGDLLQRVGEPFLTTKEPGRGMGLGLFLARSVLERVGGALDLRSVTGHGTTAAMRIPLAAANGENGGRFHEGS